MLMVYVTLCPLLYVHSGFAIILMGRESWLLYFVCLPGVSLILCGFSSRCHGFVCSLWLWYFLIILAYYFCLFVMFSHKLILWRCFHMVLYLEWRLPWSAVSVCDQQQLSAMTLKWRSGGQVVQIFTSKYQWMWKQFHRSYKPRKTEAIFM